MNSTLKAKLSKLPNSPGVYFFLNKSGDIIYIGKATSLRSRVRSYFQSKHNDYKTPLLVENIYDLRTIDANSSVEALFLEAEFIKRHKPLYNVREKDDKNFIYIRVAVKEDFPYITIVRRPEDDKSRYFGPFIASFQVKEALRYLRKTFPYYTKSQKLHISKLEYQIGNIPHPSISKQDYSSSIRKLMLIFEGKTNKLLSELEKEMNSLAKAKNFEKAAEVRNQYLAIKGLSTKISIGDDDGHDIQLDQALSQLSKTLGLSCNPRRIECYDISNFSGVDAVASMIVFTDGIPDQKQYRHFKMRVKGPNDFAMMQETIQRRFSSRNSKWPLPDLIIVDGGKGQLSSVIKTLQEMDIKIPICGLAKRYETIVVQDTSNGNIKYTEHNFERQSPVLHLVQRIRDEAHRFAISYHRVTRKKRIDNSELENIEGIGPATTKKLLQIFKSVKSIRSADIDSIAKQVGVSKARIIYNYFNNS
ncbi:MAG TPA: excinuclease ABC subunit UvrC [Candidatus Saccharibacteria bacterium]|nr:excinuclease ABC subunit UvrC [Candidatus Saccharibacteria bacterium]HMT39854.1 excinuclease ABC subunit UvrC [Candidatus Saccharibacteria bacterium]